MVFAVTTGLFLEFLCRLGSPSYRGGAVEISPEVSCSIFPRRGPFRVGSCQLGIRA